MPLLFDGQSNTRTVGLVAYTPSSKTGGSSYQVENLDSESKGKSLCFMITTGVILFLLFTFLILFFIQPRRPSFNISSLTVSNFAFVDSKLNADWKMKIQIYNPNTMPVDLDHIQIYFSYKNNILANNSLPPVELKVEDKTIFGGNFVSNQSSVAREMERDWKKGKVIMSVKMKMWLRIKNKQGVAALVKDHIVYIFCQNLELMFDSHTGNGRLPPGLWHCRFRDVRNKPII